MKKFAVRKILPHFLRSRLWGNRKRWGLAIDEQDPSWSEYLEILPKFYLETQRSTIGTRVCDAGYSVMASINLTGKRVLEIGAGDISHLSYWQGKPSEYVLADVSLDMMEFAKNRLSNSNIPYSSFCISRNQPLSLDDSSVDIIVSFYSLEHLYPLQPYLDEIKRVLKPGGLLVGAIPAEGGLAWGGGRLLTTRRWFKKNTSIDYDKIICWEHPNFADQIITKLDQVFDREALEHWPLRWAPVIDVNLILRFKYQKPLF